MPYARRVQRVGSGTLTVSLPRRWVEKTGLKPGDVVSIVELSDSVLKLETKPTKTPQHTVFTLDVGKIKDSKLLSRLLIGAYLQGFEETNIIGGDGITEEMQAAIASTVDLLPGVEIVEQSFRKIVIQSFLDPGKFPVPSIIKRIQVMLTMGINNLAEALREGRREPLLDVEKMETKIDELYFLCIRQIFFSVKKEVWGEEVSDPYIGAIGDRLVVRALEEIADSLKLAADEVEALIEKDLPKAVVNKLVKLLESIQVVFGKTMKAFLSLDIQLANEIIETTSQEYGEEMTLSDVFPQNLHSVEMMISLRNFVYNIVNIARNCKIIAEVTLNRFVRTPSKLVTLEKV
ncbi:MAG: phosphate uptake regulator PhoU [Candidatus Caldarchaeum sp.]|nr:phosphate uptake regulator PhoU [Candidatus Caldarchaeum sp.]MDW8358978.1 phosphate uptake regulator PhoU [Candidatus Caldarchaeum sp.]